jgi:Flp pilus assembly pilin Flp
MNAADRALGGAATSNTAPRFASFEELVVRRSARASERKGGDNFMTFSEWFELLRTHWRKEEGQTMAEYGVVLAVITIGAVAVFTALSGGISGALNRVVGLLPAK